MEDAITTAIENAMAEATPAAEPVQPETTEAEAASETAETAEGSADIEEGQEAAPEEGAQPQATEKPKPKRGPIPYDRHEAVLSKARRDAAERETELQRRIEALAKYETPDYQARLKFLDVLENEPKRAVEILRQHVPDKFGALTWAEQQAAQAVAAQTAATPDKPEPDTILPSGEPGYSAAAADALLRWHLGQERKSFEEKIAALEAKVTPVAEERAAREAFHLATQRMSKVLDDARTNWDGFKDNEAAIKQALETNPAWNLERAYAHVVVPKLKSDREAIEKETRARVLAEINAKGKAKTVAPGQLPAAGAQPETTDPDERLTQVIRESMKSIA